MINQTNPHSKIDGRYYPDYAVSLGEMISYEMETRGITQQDLIGKSGLTGKIIDDLNHAKAPLTSEVAAKLEKAIGMPK